MSVDPRGIDAGVRTVVARFNAIPGVTTRASCEGTAETPDRHRHADLAYVALHYPMSFDLQEHLVQHMGDLARIEDDAIYSRWPDRNAAFIARLATVINAYPNPLVDRAHLEWPLARIRAQIARLLSRQGPAELYLCTRCRTIIPDAHAGHQAIAILHTRAEQLVDYFMAFAAQPANHLDAQLIAADGWPALMQRSRRGDFGAAFHRRWLRFRAQQTAILATAGMRRAVADARRQGMDIDFTHNATHACFAWHHSLQGSAAP